MRPCRVLVALFLLLALLPWPAVKAQSSIQVSNDQATIAFPERITFQMEVQSDADIDRVVLEYGVAEMTCGQVVAEAFPEVTAATQMQVQWTWEMKQSGSQPPGARVWWRWSVHDTAGNELLTDKQELTWIDDQHSWRTLGGGSVNLHWYEGSNSFVKELHDSAVQSLASLAQSTTLTPDAPIDVYIYASTDDLRAAVLYEPGWTGGLAYPEYGIVIIGISEDQLDWGKGAVAHELTHVLVGRRTFSCLSDIPTWLQEGLAVYGEGGPDETSQQLFDSAVADDTLLSVRALSGGFSEDPAKADISYSQSYSLVKFLIERYGPEKMLALLGALRGGATVDEAMQTVYSLTLETFEDGWRAAIGANPRAPSGQPPTPTPLPTVVPTYAPVSGELAAPTAGPTRVRPTSEPTAAPTAPPPASPVPTAAPATPAGPAVPVWAWVIGGAVLILLFILTAGILLGRRARREG